MAGGTGAIMAIVTIIVIAYVGILVTDKIDDSVTISNATVQDAGMINPLYNSESNMQNNSGGAFDLVSIAPIAAAAGLVIAMLVGWMGSRN